MELDYADNVNTEYTAVLLSDGGEERFTLAALTPGGTTTLPAEGLIVYVSNDDYDGEWRPDNTLPALYGTELIPSAISEMDSYHFRYARDFGDYVQRLKPLELHFCVGSEIEITPPAPVSANDQGTVTLLSARRLSAPDAIGVEEQKVRRVFIEFDTLPARGATVNLIVANKFEPFTASPVVKIGGETLPVSRYSANSAFIEVRSVVLPQNGDLTLTVDGLEFRLKLDDVAPPPIPRTGDAHREAPVIAAAVSLLILAIAAAAYCKRGAKK